MATETNMDSKSERWPSGDRACAYDPAKPGEVFVAQFSRLVLANLDKCEKSKSLIDTDMGPCILGVSLSPDSNICVVYLVDKKDGWAGWLEVFQADSPDQRRKYALGKGVFLQQIRAYGDKYIIVIGVPDNFPSRIVCLFDPYNGNITPVEFPQKLLEDRHFRLLCAGKSLYALLGKTNVVCKLDANYQVVEEFQVPLGTVVSGNGLNLYALKRNGRESSLGLLKDGGRILPLRQLDLTEREQAFDDYFVYNDESVALALTFMQFVYFPAKSNAPETFLLDVWDSVYIKQAWFEILNNYLSFSKDKRRLARGGMRSRKRNPDESLVSDGGIEAAFAYYMATRVQAVELVCPDSWIGPYLDRDCVYDPASPGEIYVAQSDRLMVVNFDKCEKARSVIDRDRGPGIFGVSLSPDSNTCVLYLLDNLIDKGAGWLEIFQTDNPDQRRKYALERGMVLRRIIAHGEFFMLVMGDTNNSPRRDVCLLDPSDGRIMPVDFPQRILEDRNFRLLRAGESLYALLRETNIVCKLDANYQVVEEFQVPLDTFVSGNGLNLYALKYNGRESSLGILKDGGRILPLRQLDMTEREQTFADYFVYNDESVALALTYFQFVYFPAKSGAPETFFLTISESFYLRQTWFGMLKSYLSFSEDKRRLVRGSMRLWKRNPHESLSRNASIKAAFDHHTRGQLRCLAPI